MKYRERMKIRANQADIEEVLLRLGELELQINSPSRRLMIVEFDHSPERYQHVMDQLSEISNPVKVYRSITPIYDDNDFAEAELFQISYPDLNIAGIDTVSTRCSGCENRVSGRPPTACASLLAKVSIAFVNNDFSIISKALRDLLEREGLSGLSNVPFDDAHQHLHFAARSSIGELMVHEDEFVAYGGRCSQCNSHRYEMHFGPQRYKRSNWSLDDFVSTDLRGGDVDRKSHV